MRVLSPSVLPRAALPAALLFAACGTTTPAAESPAPRATARAARQSSTPASSAQPNRAESEPSEPPSEDAGASTTNQSGACPDGMAAIPAGTLWMGSPPGRGRADEHPQHAVQVRAFCLDLREVTVTDYEDCVQDRICRKPHRTVHLMRPKGHKAPKKRSAWCTARHKSVPDLPLTCVEQVEAKKYCDWKGGRLPTEAEWEYAATGGADKLDYPWGSKAPNDALLCWRRSNGPCKAGWKPAGAFGLLDMEGNVSDWTSTYYAPYTTPPGRGSKLVVRGADWMTKRADAVRPQARSAHLPLFRDVDLGFRCAKDQ